MATRREAREWALQVLFHLDVNPDKPEKVLRWFWQEYDAADARNRAFVERVVLGVGEHRKEIDDLITQYAENWSLHRMGVVDRNVLRMAIFEMLYCEDIPPVVSINEAVDVAKYFGNDESGRFVNGIVDRIRKTIQREPRQATRKTAT